MSRLEVGKNGEIKPISESFFPAPFKAGLEYSSPARGCWNIVHTGMLIPESHQIFVCAKGCLRGVVLTAAEMGVMDRYSSLVIEEDNVIDGGMEEFMIEGVKDVLSKLKYTPKAVLLFISCQHFFLAYDQNIVFKALRENFPDIEFLDCYMIPTLRKSGITPDQKMRIQLYKMIKKTQNIVDCSNNVSKSEYIEIQKGANEAENNKFSVNLIGSNLPLFEKSELNRFLKDNKTKLKQIWDCKTFEEYEQLGNSDFNILYEPIAVEAAKELKQRLDMDYFYISFSYDDKELLEEYSRLLKFIRDNSKVSTKVPLCENIKLGDTADLEKYFWSDIAELENQWEETRQLIGDTPIVIDQSFTFRILSLAKRLLEEGFNIARIYVDMFVPEDKENFEWIKNHHPEIEICPISRPVMRMASRNSDICEENIILALGQKGAYFTGTDYFVNVVESGGYFGFQGMIELTKLMREAFLHRKDVKKMISVKGMGCERMLL